MSIDRFIETGEGLKIEKPTSNDKLSFDQSKRWTDENGFLRVQDCWIMKEDVNEYYGREIVNFSEFGLDPDEVYQVYRPFEEFAQNASTFNGLPILSTHRPISSEELTKDSVKALQIGSIGTDVKAVEDHLEATLIFTDEDAIKEILSDEIKELSPGYRYESVLESGTFNGKPYTIKMTNIRGNHLTKVEKGRQGPDVVVADSRPVENQQKENLKMKFEKLRKALRSSFAKKGMAADDAEASIDDTLENIGEAAEAIEEALETAVEAKSEVQSETSTETTSDANPAELLAALMDEITDEELRARLSTILEMLTATSDEDKEDDKKATAMDAAMIRADFNKALERAKIEARLETRKEMERHSAAKHQALEDVRPLVGLIDSMSFDSAREVYEYALSHNDMTPKPTTDIETLKTMVKVLVDNKSKKYEVYAFDSKTPKTKAAELISKVKVRKGV